MRQAVAPKNMKSQFLELWKLVDVVLDLIFLPIMMWYYRMQYIYIDVDSGIQTLNWNLMLFKRDHVSYISHSTFQSSKMLRISNG